MVFLMLLVMMLVYSVILTAIYPMRMETLETLSRERLDASYLLLVLVLIAGIIEIAIRILIQV